MKKAKIILGFLLGYPFVPIRAEISKLENEFWKGAQGLPFAEYFLEEGLKNQNYRMIEKFIYIFEKESSLPQSIRHKINIENAKIFAEIEAISQKNTPHQITIPELSPSCHFEIDGYKISQKEIHRGLGDTIYWGIYCYHEAIVLNKLKLSFTPEKIALKPPSWFYEQYPLQKSTQP